jgi:hypothetical protein
LLPPQKAVAWFAAGHQSNLDLKLAFASMGKSDFTDYVLRVTTA